MTDSYVDPVAQGREYQQLLLRLLGDRDPAEVARFGEVDQARLLADPGIVRNRAKIKAAIGNAQAALRVRAEFGSLHAYFVEAVPQPPARLTPTAERGTIPITTPVSDTLSKDLKWRGLKFVGSTIVYSFMQAVGLVDDHLPGCFRYRA